MLEIDIYNDAISKTWTYLILNMLPLFIGGIILIAIALIGFYKQLIKKSIIYLLLILSVTLLSYAIIEISVFNNDIKNENFAIYYGEFDYMQVSGNRKDTFKFPNKSAPYIRSVADLNINSGTHSGYIMYCGLSRWAIAYSNTPFK